MSHKFEKNDTAFLIESNRFIREVKIIKYDAELYLVRFVDSTGGIKVRENRLYASEEEAKAMLPKPKESKVKSTSRHRTPWD